MSKTADLKLLAWLLLMFKGLILSLSVSNFPFKERQMNTSKCCKYMRTRKPYLKFSKLRDGLFLRTG